MKTLLTFIWLVLANNIFAGDCALETGRYYAPIGGSEWHTVLEFLSDGKVILQHENWMPLHYEDRSVQRVIGTWSCRNSEVSILLGEKEYIGILGPVGPNPLGIDEDRLVLRFPDTGKVDDLVDGGLFYEEQLFE